MSSYILALDPGKLTGVALLRREAGVVDPILEGSWELQQDEIAPIVRDIIWNPIIKNDIDIVCERFIINAQTVRNSQAPYSLEVIGILKQCLFDNGKTAEEIYFQAPANAMAMFTNEKLRKLGYWHRGGAGHALDAIRHALLRAVNSGWKPVGLLKD
jgi:hypothetical protein